MWTKIALALCGIQIAAEQVLGCSALLQSTASPLGQNSLVTSTPLLTSPLMVVPKLLATENGMTPATLTSFLKHEGFDAVKLKHKDLDSDPKRLVIDAKINRVSASLEVDTGANGTVVARGSLKKFGVVEEKTPIGVAAFGEKAALNRFWGLAKLDTLAIGNRVIHTVPVGIREVPHGDGLLGCPELHRLGAVLDCAGSALYLAPRGPSRRTSDQIAALLRTKGFRQVPLRLNSDHHLDVDCSINGVPATILIDTGSQFTFVDENIGIKAGIVMRQVTTTARASDRRQLSIGRAKKLAVGDFEMTDVDIYFEDLRESDHPSAYLLGMNELASHFAIIDAGGLNLYLRRAQ